MPRREVENVQKNTSSPVAQILLQSKLGHVDVIVSRFARSSQVFQFTCNDFPYTHSHIFRVN